VRGWDREEEAVSAQKNPFCLFCLEGKEINVVSGAETLKARREE
jgi:hypothetical protein